MEASGRSATDGHASTESGPPPPPPPSLVVRVSPAKDSASSRPSLTPQTRSSSPAKDSASSRPSLTPQTRSSSPAKDSAPPHPSRMPQARTASPAEDPASSRPSLTPQMRSASATKDSASPTPQARNASPAMDSASSRPLLEPQVREASPAQVSFDESFRLSSLVSTGVPPAEATAGASPHPQAIVVSLPRHAISGSSRAIEILVDLIGVGEVELYQVHAYTEHKILDVKEYFERLKAHDLYTVRDMVATQNGIIMSDDTWITEHICGASISIIVQSALPDFDRPTNSCCQDLHEENFNLWSDDGSYSNLYFENTADDSLIWSNSSHWDIADSMLDFRDHLENSDTSHSITKDNTVVEDQVVTGSSSDPHAPAVPSVILPESADYYLVGNQDAHTALTENTSVTASQAPTGLNCPLVAERHLNTTQTAIPCAVNASDHSNLPENGLHMSALSMTENPAPPATNDGPEQVLHCGGRLLLPEGFSDQNLLTSNLHGFKTSYDLRSKINNGDTLWISKQEAYALLSNPVVFSIGVIQEESKKDGLVCVVESANCNFPTTLKGYKVTPNEESLEYTFEPMNYRGVKLDWHEVRGQLWARRRLSLRDGNNGFEVVQWRQSPIKKKAVAQKDTAKAVAQKEAEQSVEEAVPTQGGEGGASSSSSSLVQSVAQLLAQQTVLLDRVSAQQRVNNDIVARLERFEAQQSMLLDHVSAQQRVSEDIVARLDRLEKLLGS